MSTQATLQYIAWIEAAVCLYSTLKLLGTTAFFAKHGGSAAQPVFATSIFVLLALVGNLVLLHGVLSRANSGDVGLLRVVFVALLQAVSHFIWSWARRTVQPQQLSRALSQDIPKTLISGGPYTYIRNPFYTAYLTSYAAATVLSNRSGDYVLLACFYACYYLTSLDEERKFSESSLADAYAQFKTTRARFFFMEF